MKTKTVGVIGGLGPETTANFYLEVISKSKLVDAAQRPQMAIWSVPMDLAIEDSFIKGGDQNSTYTSLLIEGAKKLESIGADFLVIPCNSVHVFINQIRQAVSIPVLSIVEETDIFLKDHNLTKVGLLATSATVKSNIYGELLEQHGVQVVLPSPSEQVELDLSITRLVNNQSSEQDKQNLGSIITTLANNGVQTTLLACTDLQLMTPSHPTVAIYDTMHILVESTVKNIFEG
jgi:aspartate racemase